MKGSSAGYRINREYVRNVVMTSFGVQLFVLQTCSSPPDTITMSGPSIEPLAAATVVGGLVVGATCTTLWCMHLRGRDKPWISAARKVLRQPDVRPRDLPVDILPYLLLGDKRCAADVALLEAFGVTHVLNAAGRAGRQPVHVLEAYKAANIEVMQLDAEDEE